MYVPHEVASPCIAAIDHSPAASLQTRQAAGRRQQRDGISETMGLLVEALAPTRRIVHTGDIIYRSGAAFDCLHVINSGLVKIVSLTQDGREQVVGLKFRGDWLGFDGIAGSAYACDAVAMDTGEVWTISYEALLRASTNRPQLLQTLLQAMSGEITRDRESLTSVCTLSADARVADFLHYWAASLGKRGLRTDQISLRMTRAEIGNYLGMTLESVSRALSRLARERLIAFVEKGRRDVRIPDLAGLAAFVERSVAPQVVALQ